MERPEEELSHTVSGVSHEIGLRGLVLLLSNQLLTVYLYLLFSFSSISVISFFFWMVIGLTLGEVSIGERERKERIRIG